MFKNVKYHPAGFLIALLLFCNGESIGQCVAQFDFNVNDLTVSFNNRSSLNTAIFQWNFGDGTASTQRDPSHAYQAAGEYFVKLKVGTPNGICDSITRRICLRCVYPGDANNDGIVNNKDVLFVGLAYGAIGPRRHNPSQDSLTPSTPWVMSTGVANFHLGPNINHADCDGDGIINQHDLRVIERNYGNPVQKSPGTDCINVADIPLYFEILDSIPAGTSVEVAIMLGTAQIPAQDVYGIAYTIHYSSDLIIPGTVSLNYNNSLFGASGDVLALNKDFSPDGKMETAIARIDRNDITVTGQIGAVNFVMEENLAQKTMITEILNLSFSDITLIRSDETVIPVCGWQDSSVVYEKVLTSSLGVPSEKRISIYPNPANNSLHIELPQHQEYQIEVMNVIGKQMLRQTGTFGVLKLDVSHLVWGIYFVSVRDNETVQLFKVEISR